MPRFAANLSMMFPESPFTDRFACAARDGFEAVEFLFPYEWPAAKLADRLSEHGLTQALFNLPPGNWEWGDRGLACRPERGVEFRESVDLALEYARALDCPRLHVMAGLVADRDDREALHTTYIENLRLAADRAAAQGATVLVEPLNPHDMPGYFLASVPHALDVIAEVGRPNLKLQADIYHMQRIQGELASTLADHIDVIGHVQIADTPGRHEPGTGEINYPFLFATLDQLGYDGWVGCEYLPSGGAGSASGWMRDWRRH
ncbi:2-oxo-tetronate isomerase [Antarcticimicrobium luteum]|uniref:Hydroxypyruvate isomerase n=1 Tax=Antarcticimicrobium luteum TaxID=2547397 RepID=A0A4R5V1P0_9RHOB|nr:2-oxo-tetronate isomerase [Antarcticimicrobium luteum]TDK45644.1 hydroxypyruvate isomerase [Antarcticimicrobium luteum]